MKSGGGGAFSRGKLAKRSLRIALAFARTLLNPSIDMFDCTPHSSEMCSGSEAGSYLRLIDFVYHSTLGLRVIKKKKRHHIGESGRSILERESLLNV